MESVTAEDVLVNFTPEEWALLNPSQKNLYKTVMLETFQNLVFIEQKCGEQTFEDDRKNVRKKQRRQMVKGIHEQKEIGQCAETISKNPDHGVHRKTHLVKACETRAPGNVDSCPSSQKKHNISRPKRSPYARSTGKPYECQKCGKAFKWPSVLLNHERIHSGEKPYVCEQCGKAFSCPVYCRRHVQTHNAEKPYVCKQCGQAFRRSSFYQIHERIHTGEKPYVCKHCGKAFTRASSCRIHERIHSGEKPYVCEQCGKAFRELQKMRRHGQVHTKARPHVIKARKSKSVLVTSKCKEGATKD